MSALPHFVTHPEPFDFQAEAEAISAAAQQARREGYAPGSDAFELRVLQLTENVA
jgi:hypothetical protein